MFKDIESGEYVTIEQLEAEYATMKEYNPEEYNYSFNSYLYNCLTSNGGTLEKVF